MTLEQAAAAVRSLRAARDDASGDVAQAHQAYLDACGREQSLDNQLRKAEQELLKVALGE